MNHHWWTLIDIDSNKLINIDDHWPPWHTMNSLEPYGTHQISWGQNRRPNAIKGERKKQLDLIWGAFPPDNKTACTHARHETIFRLDSHPPNSGNHIYEYVSTYTYICSHIDTYRNINIYRHIYTYIWIYKYIYIYIHIYMHTHIYTCTYMYTYIYIYTNIYIWTHICRCI